MDRRLFIRQAGGMAVAASIGLPGFPGSATPQRIALVGTGVRGVDMWGKQVVDKYGDRVRFVGLCDINPGRVAMAKAYLGVDCPTYTDFERMMKETRPDTLIVTTVDSTHHEFILSLIHI